MKTKANQTCGLKGNYCSPLKRVLRFVIIVGVGELILSITKAL